MGEFVEEKQLTEAGMSIYDAQRTKKAFEEGGAIYSQLAVRGLLGPTLTKRRAGQSLG